MKKYIREDAAVEVELFASLAEQLKPVVSYDDVAFSGVQGLYSTTLYCSGFVSTETSCPWGFQLEPCEDDGLYFQDALVVSDTRSRSPEARAVHTMAAGQFDTIFRHSRSCMITHLKVDGRIIASLLLGSREPGYYTARHMELTLDFLRQAAGGIREAVRCTTAVWRADAFRTLLDDQQAIVGLRDVDGSLQAVAAAACRATSARTAIIYLLEDGCLQPAAAAGYRDATGRTGLRWPPSTSLIEQVVRTAEPRCCLDLPRDPFSPELWHAVLSVPLLAGRRALGALVLVDKILGTFGPADEEILTILAQSGAIAVENAGRCARREAAARLRERERIAREMHDKPAQTLFAIGLEARRAAVSSGEALGHTLETIDRLAERGGDEIRHAIASLSGCGRDEGDLVESLRELVADFRVQGGVDITLVSPPRLAAPVPDVGEAVLGIVREALTNVRKHARASAVAVDLRTGKGWITVTVQDDGMGLAEAARDDGRRHFGIGSMRRLAKQAGGCLEITNNDDGGVLVRAKLPIVDRAGRKATRGATGAGDVPPPGGACR